MFYILIKRNNFFLLILFKSNYLGNNNIGFRLEKYFRNIFILEEKKSSKPKYKQKFSFFFKEVRDYLFRYKLEFA